MSTDSLEPVAYFNGQFVPQSAARLAINDAGFILGATVSEQLRTFGGRVFRLQEHLDRFAHSLAVVGITLSQSCAELAAAAAELVARNHPLLAAGDDLGVSLFATPGPYATLAGRGAQTTGPTLGMHTYPLPFQLWRDKYRTGESLATPQIRQVPAECWPVDIKCRSRMHYYLADKEAQRVQPGARALMLDLAGHVLETSTANVLVYRADTGLVSPPPDTVLPGISLAVTKELAAAQGLAVTARTLVVDDLLSADEVLLTSTPYCLLPATRINGAAIGSGQPGPIFQALLQAWSGLVGLDIADQARSVAIP